MNSQSLARKAKSSRHLGVLHDVPSQQSDGILPPRALVHLVIERAALRASDIAHHPHERDRSNTVRFE
jgi:hypothetical protein